MSNDDRLATLPPDSRDRIQRHIAEKTAELVKWEEERPMRNGNARAAHAWPLECRATRQRLWRNRS